ncbi:MAG: hypothetical protein OK438_04120 [Thaumarchaeota archaeon]|nr:hypothetical protein [Nitrososphaerota archaeon]
MQKRRKRPRSALKRSFLVTFTILIILLIGAYAYVYENSIPVKHIPPSVPPYEAVWAKYVPNDVILFSFQNFTSIHQLNSSLPFFSTILHLTNPKVTLSTRNVNLFVAMEFSVPNASVDIAFLSPSSFASVQENFSSITSYGTLVGNDTLYNVLDTATGKPVLGWLALIPGDRAVGFAPGSGEALTAMTDAVRVPTENNASVIGLPDIRQMLYVAGGAGGHIGLGVASFSGVISTSSKTMTVVDGAGPRLNVSRIVEFPDYPTARGQFSTVMHTYKAATNFIVFDAFVRASQLDPMSKLGGDYRLVQ